MDYKPPYKITPSIITSIERIGEALGVLKALNGSAAVPQLRRQNQIRTIQASLEIEGNTLSLEQVSSVIEGKRVLGKPREIQEVKNALKAYEQLENLSPVSFDDFLEAHKILTQGLVEQSGVLRSTQVGIFRGSEVAHVAPPADMVAGNIANLFGWLRDTDEHPLVVSCVFHYEIEFIHPFQDGNGRIGRFWQTLILSRWKPVFLMLPVESIVRDRQQEYYQALAECDKAGQATVFIEFMLEAILAAILEASQLIDQATDQATDQVVRLLQQLREGAKSSSELMKALKLSHRPSFRKNYLQPAMKAGFISMTEPDKPNVSSQKYELLAKGRDCLEEIGGGGVSSR